MRRAPALATAWLLTLGLLVGAPMATAAPSRPTTDYVTLDSAPGHSPGQGQSLSWTGDQIVNVHGGRGGLLINVSESGSTEQPSWSWTLRPAAGGWLDVGDYVVVPESTRPLSQPSIELGGDGNGCNQESGRFRIMELAADLSRVWIFYEHRCEGSGDPGTAAWGEIRIGMPAVEPNLMLLPEELELPDWYPGLDAVAQPVMVFNTGTESLTVTSAAVTAGGNDFRVVSGVDSCADLAPRESCRIFVGFRPGVAGDRRGTLRLSTSAGIREVPLRGYGFPGVTEFRLQGGGNESYVITPDGWTMGGNNRGQQELPERSAAFFADEPGYRGDWISIGFTAPEGGFRAGRTYSGCCTDAGPSMRLGITGRGYRPGGTYTVHEVGYDGEGNLERFAASFRMHVGGWYVGTIAWRAASAPLMPTVPSDNAATPLTVETDRTTYTSGDTAAVTVTVPGGAGAEATLYANRRLGGPYAVGTMRTDALGRARFEVPVTSEDGFYAASGAHSGQTQVEVSLTARVVAKARGQQGRSGRFLLFRAGKPARVVGAASPVFGEECLYVQVQRRRSNGWRTVEARDPCLRVVEGAVVATTLRGKAGERQRVRLILPALDVRRVAASSWIYVAFVRRER